MISKWFLINRMGSEGIRIGAWFLATIIGVFDCHLWYFGSLCYSKITKTSNFCYGSFLIFKNTLEKARKSLFCKKNQLKFVKQKWTRHPPALDLTVSYWNCRIFDKRKTKIIVLIKKFYILRFLIVFPQRVCK